MDKNMGRNVIIVLLLVNGWLLLHYAPLVPRVVILMDDIHELRERSTGWMRTIEDVKKTGEGIQTTLTNLEKKFSFFRAEAQKRGQSWP